MATVGKRQTAIELVMAEAINGNRHLIYEALAALVHK